MKHTILRSINFALMVTFMVWIFLKPPYTYLIAFLAVSFITCCWQGILKEYITSSYVVWNASLILIVNVLAYIVLDYAIPIVVSVIIFALMCVCDKLRHTKL